MRQAISVGILLWSLNLIDPLPVRAAGDGDYQPDPRSVQRYGPAYRYPQDGWIVLHIEGKPYPRGYQHGRLLATEIAAHVRCYAAFQNPSAPAQGWKTTRKLVNALFLRRYEKEYLEEMKGIADGASAAGARFDSRRIDVVDIVALNSWPEIETLDSALNATATGLEGKRFPHDQPKMKLPPKPMHCSAFAATGPATADGKIVFGHITMFSLYPSLFYNVWLDVKPDKGHRVLMQTYPGGIQSGLDYYLNSAGILVCETTIAQTKFDIKGMCVASRIRQALQYADSIDKAVEILKKDNNGLYTNEWLLADTKTNEIAMFELGTHKSKLYRSSKKEWFGGTEGFYWGCNNAKDLQVRLETVANVKGRPANVVFRPSARDKVWLQLFNKYNGKINVEFGKIAFTTPPIAAYHSVDAKFTTTDLAKDMKSWALFGPPLGRAWQPTRDEWRKFPEIRPLVTNPWTVLHTQVPADRDPKDTVTVKDISDRVPNTVSRFLETYKHRPVATVRAWRGTLLPKTDADVWLTSAFAEYERIYSMEKALYKRGGSRKLSVADTEKLALAMYRHRSNYLSAARISGDVPLAKTKSDLYRDEWYRIASSKGVLVMHELRKTVGDGVFEKIMDSFGVANAGKKVTSDEFRGHAEKIWTKPLNGRFTNWLHKTGLPANGGSTTVKTSLKNGLASAPGGVYTTLSFYEELDKTLIVYGTLKEQSTNFEAAENLQDAIIQRGNNFKVPIKADKDVTKADLSASHLLIIGRPDSNSLLGKMKTSWPITFGKRSFVVKQTAYAHAGSAVIAAGDNPFNARFSAVLITGLSAEAILRAAPAFVDRGRGATEVLLLANGKSPREVICSCEK